MKKSKVIKINNIFLAAAIAIDDKYLLIRNRDPEIFEKYGCYFPGCQNNSSYDKKAYLKEQIKLKYGMYINVDDFVGDVITKDHNGRHACLYLYKCSFARSPSFENMTAKAGLISIKDFDKIHFDEADGIIAKKLQLFDKVYSKRFVPFLSRSPEETKKIKVLAGCLNYFKEYVANQDMLDFSSLLKTNATYEEIHKAFNWICSRANIDINEYIKNIERKGGIK